ncbi:hypothetical protein GCM10010946_31930 [Undibacterium squillarum]|uniref:Uncharacterized protein n=1 Tax=Undibacterium squillarum TaxID=1131567 RepID=A0ABQ2Y374_9BURK|nr:hypothetical protein GCM10010946_31930 [Undibacterium squillarum]
MEKALNCAEIVICDFVTAGVSADDRRIAVPESAFRSKTGLKRSPIRRPVCVRRTSGKRNLPDKR